MSDNDKRKGTEGPNTGVEVKPRPKTRKPTMYKVLTVSYTHLILTKSISNALPGLKERNSLRAGKHGFVNAGLIGFHQLESLPARNPARGQTVRKTKKTGPDWGRPFYQAVPGPGARAPDPAGNVCLVGFAKGLNGKGNAGGERGNRLLGQLHGRVGELVALGDGFLDGGLGEAGLQVNRFLDGLHAHQGLGERNGLFDRGLARSSEMLGNVCLLYTSRCV